MCVSFSLLIYILQLDLGFGIKVNIIRPYIKPLPVI